MNYVHEMCNDKMKCFGKRNEREKEIDFPLMHTHTHTHAYSYTHTWYGLCNCAKARIRVCAHMMYLHMSARFGEAGCWIYIIWPQRRSKNEKRQNHWPDTFFVQCNYWYAADVFAFFVLTAVVVVVVFLRLCVYILT